MGLERKDYVRIGVRFNGARLSEQAGYSLGLARDEAQILALLGITPERTTQWEAFRTQVETGSRDRGISRDEAVALTGVQNAHARNGKMYIRRVLQIAGNAFAEEPGTFDEFTKIPRPQQSLPKLLEAVNRLAELSTKYASQLSAWGGANLAAEGRGLLDQIKTVDAEQERKITSLPTQTEDYYVAKGRLFLAIKQINRAGKTAHIADKVAADRYNLDILYRHTGRKPQPAGTGISN